VHWKRYDEDDSITNRYVLIGFHQKPHLSIFDKNGDDTFSREASFVGRKKLKKKTLLVQSFEPSEPGPVFEPLEPNLLKQTFGKCVVDQ
jgi:hypothetical protein